MYIPYVYVYIYILLLSLSFIIIIIFILDVCVDHPLSSAQCLVRICMYHVQKAKSNLMLERS